MSQRRAATMAPRKPPLGVAPFWLQEAGPDRDVCISSRVRIMRNVRGFRFPTTADGSELAQVVELVETGASTVRDFIDARVLSQIASTERDQLVADRLISVEFPIQSLHRRLWLDPMASLSLMINEEDHLRLQALHAGWNLGAARDRCKRIASQLGDEIGFACSPQFGFLAASPYNCGDGMRISAMFHLIGLAHLKKLKRLLEMLGSQNLVARGLFGEHSRAIGAMVQVSVLGDDLPLLLGAGDVLIGEERSAREKIGFDRLSEQAVRVREFAISSRSIPLADALRIFAWVRWASSATSPGFDPNLLRVDGLLRHLSLCSVAEEGRSAERRATVLREALEYYRGS